MGLRIVQTPYFWDAWKHVQYINTNKGSSEARQKRVNELCSPPSSMFSPPCNVPFKFLIN